ncbi:restriction endonuclease subunit S [uncultured Treponema sp.]|uniref:restriction endonuclease subunit S n=1 Tax=uncultured Treponema sp. TaxID=162155 RepID=UPI0025E861F9|nr:restriction endonuclease subunit S [uncultured Treponema sp.]
MKDSGIDWIGKIPDEWTARQIRYLFEIRDERNYKPLSEVNLISVYTDKGVLQHNDIEQTTGNKAQNADGYKHVYKNDLVVNIILCWMGALGISDFDGVTSPAYDVYSPKNLDLIFPKYYHYLFRTPQFNGKCYTEGRGIMQMRWRTYSSEFKSIKVPFPPLSEQTKIAGFLDKKCSEIDSVIEESKKSIEEYKAWKQSVIFEAVTGKNLSCKKKNSGIEWLGEIPETWEVCKLKYLLKTNLQYGANSSGIEFNENLPRYVRITDIKSSETLYEKGKLSLSDEDSKGYLLQDGDILFARSGATVGKTFLYHSNIGKAAFAGYLIRAQLNENLNPKFLSYYTLSSGYDEWKNRIFIQATIQNIGADKYANMEIPFPPLSEQESIAKFLDKKCAQIDSLISEKQSLIKDLAEYKKSLIFEAVTGKRRV